MTYQETIDFLFERLPMFSRLGEKAIKKDLDNIIALCEILCNPQQSFKSIHIAGTNGKGSTSHMLASVLQTAGFKTGLYTSPHIHDFRERIRINGQMIPQQQVVDFVEELFPLDIEPSFFEITVAMAFDYFAKEKVDIAIIETGLGGRLDSTNIIQPILSVITNIGMDHMQILGDTLQQIASEKAGIIKSGIPVVIGEVLPSTLPIFTQKAVSESAPLLLAKDHCSIEPLGNGRYLSTAPCLPGTQEIQMDLKGAYQAKNIATVLTALYQLQQQGFEIDTKHILEGLGNVQIKTGLQGRWQVLRTHPTVIADVAHNREGMLEVLQQLKNEFDQRPLSFILGFVSDKDVDGVLELFPKNASYYFTNAHMPRALACEELKKAAAEKGLSGQAYDDINDALAEATASASPDTVIMICGSFFILSELRS